MLIQFTGETMSKTIPDSDVLKVRDAMKTDKNYYLQSRLLWEENMMIIYLLKRDDYFTDDWIFIIGNITNRKKAVKHVSTHCHFLNIPLGKLLVVKSETMMNWKHSVSQIYQKNSVVHKVNSLDMKNIYCKGESPVLALIKQNHSKKNVTVESNYNDSPFYYLIAANERHKINNKYLNEF